MNEVAVVAGGDGGGITVTATRLPPDTTGQAAVTMIGAVAGAALCTGLSIPAGGITVPAVPYCAATGGFIGAAVYNGFVGNGSPSGSSWELEYPQGVSDSAAPYIVQVR